MCADYWAACILQRNQRQAARSGGRNRQLPRPEGLCHSVHSLPEARGQHRSAIQHPEVDTCCWQVGNIQNFRSKSETIHNFLIMLFE